MMVISTAPVASLRGPAIAFHPQRPKRMSLGAVSLTGGLPGFFTGMPSVYLGSHDLAAQMTSRERPDHPRLCQCAIFIRSPRTKKRSADYFA
jgi:hypothetical protein